MKTPPPPVCPLKHVPICTFKTSQCVPASRAHVFQHVFALCRYKRRRFERTCGDVFEWIPGFFQRFTPYHTPNTPHRPHTKHTTQDTTPHGDRQRQRKKTETEGEEETKEKTTRQEPREERRVKREKIHFQCGGAWPFFIGGVIFRLIPFAHETLAS